MTLPKKIKGPEDIVRLFLHLTRDEDIKELHPDESFHTYGIEDARGQWRPAYSHGKADVRDRLMDEAKTAAYYYNVNIYCMALLANFYAHGGYKPESCVDEAAYFKTKGVLDWEP